MSCGLAASPFSSHHYTEFSASSDLGYSMHFSGNVFRVLVFQGNTLHSLQSPMSNPFHGGLYLAPSPGGIKSKDQHQKTSLPVQNSVVASEPVSHLLSADLSSPNWLPDT